MSNTGNSCQSFAYNSLFCFLLDSSSVFFQYLLNRNYIPFMKFHPTSLSIIDMCFHGGFQELCSAFQSEYI
jgi:hypothetical protein